MVRIGEFRADGVHFSFTLYTGDEIPISREMAIRIKRSLTSGMPMSFQLGGAVLKPDENHTTRVLLYYHGAVYAIHRSHILNVISESQAAGEVHLYHYAPEDRAQRTLEMIV